MSSTWRVPIAVILLLFSVLTGMAQDTRLAEWLAVPPQRAGIVLTIDFPVNEARIFSGTKLLAAKKWIPKFPLVWQLQVQPDIYQFQFQQGPIAQIGVVAKQPGTLTFVNVAPVRAATGNIGLTTTVIAGSAPTAVTDILENAAKNGFPDVFATDFIESGNKLLLVSTDPPWPIPPPPPKR